MSRRQEESKWGPGGTAHGDRSSWGPCMDWGGYAEPEAVVGETQRAGGPRAGAGHPWVGST